MNQQKAPPNNLASRMQVKDTKEKPIVNVLENQKPSEADPNEYLIQAFNSTFKSSVPVSTKNHADAATILESVRIDPSVEVMAPPACLSIIEDGQEISIATLGNFSLIIGKAKSRKTFFSNLLIASYLKKSLVMGKILGTNHNGQDQVLIFDTEQSHYHASLSIQRICKLVGVNNPKNLKAFSLRRFSTEHRLKLIEEAINTTKNLGLVLIDGCRDLVTSINDEQQATMLVSKLLRLSSELNIHIICVLHQNKQDNSARGHLGSELVNKAESVLSVTKDRKNNALSIVKADYCRDIEPESFAFDIDDKGLPRILLKGVKGKGINSNNEGSEKKAPSDDDCKKVLEAVFGLVSKQRYKELSDNLKKEFNNFGFDVGDNRIAKQIKQYQEKGWIKATGRHNTKNRKYELNIN